ncbi:MAG: hypothetical protein GX638_06350, partial [Crenarchaeota archaeon]|nr:hypothetical protein [Thermoproteota archaeon]
EEAVAISEPVIEEAVTFPVEAQVEASPNMEESPIEQSVDDFAETPIEEEADFDFATAQEIATPELVADAVEDIVAKKAPLDAFEVSTTESIQKNLTQLSEESIPENPREALVAAQENEIVDTIHEDYARTQQMHLHYAKETLHEAYSDSEDKE